MNINNIGFEIGVIGENEYINLSDIFNSLSLNKKGNQMGDGKVAFINSQKSELFYFGLIATFKDQKSFTAFNEETEQCENITLNDKQKFIALNFFILNKKTNTGLYLYYRESCSLTSFFTYIKSVLKEKKNEVNNKYLDEHNYSDIKKRIDKFMLKPSYIIYDEGQFRALFQSAKKINKIRMPVTFIKENDENIAIAEFAQRKMVEYVFNCKISDPSYSSLADELISKIPFFRQKSKYNTRVSIEITDSFNSPVRLNFSEQPFVFDKHKYDDLSKNFDGIKLSKFEECKIFEYLVKTFDSSSANRKLMAST